MIKNIIFDLGNVVIDIDFQLTFNALAQLSDSLTAQECERIMKEKHIWVNYEKGFLSDTDFRNTLRHELAITATDDALDTAFCGLLLDIDPARIELIKQLSTQYRLFVLSNTSSIHVVQVEKILQRCSGVSHFTDIFEKVFLSYEMGKVKPNVDIYEQVLQEANLVAQETLFLDDMLANLEGAQILGIQTKQIIPPSFTILDLFANEI